MQSTKVVSLSAFVVGAFLLLITSIPAPASAAVWSRPFEISGWIPYWRAATGTADVVPHLSQLTEINPFVYTLKSDGTLLDNGQLDQEPWVTLRAQAKAQHVRFVPTIMTSNSDLLHTLLSYQKSRVALEDRIATLAKENGFDGIDIDFEGKRAEDKNYFSTFLKGLYMRMGPKWVMCSIESRTPNDSRYYGTDIPPDASIYANDFAAINKYCDRVRIMAYDQQGVDQQLAQQAASSSLLYAPVADPVWVEKVIRLTAKSIKKSKIVIGVPTYGYEYKVTAYANNDFMYDILWTFNQRYATDLAAMYGVTPDRNAAGERFFTYTPRDGVSTTSPAQPLGQNSAQLAASAASLYATTYNSHMTFNLVDWPDAVSIAQKVQLARDLGVRGVAVFKFDGGEDQGMWEVLK